MAKFYKSEPVPLYSEPVDPANPNGTWTFRYLDESMSSGETSSSPPKRKKKSKKSKRKNWSGY